MITGQYNELRYAVFSDGDELYTAGNGFGDSQAYVSAEKGVGRERMKEYCRITCEAMADDRQEEFKGVEYCEPEEDGDEK